MLQVAVAAVRDDAGRVLIARRPPGVHQGNLWEFPGGKLEAGEDVRGALRRELWEELHIEPTELRPLIRVPYRYPDRHVLLDVWQVDAYRGSASGREGQPIRWVAPERLADYRFPAADLPIVSALRLPTCYAVTADCAPGGEAAFLDRLRAVLASGVRLVQLRARLEPSRLAPLARAAVAIAHAAGGRILLNGSPQQAVEAGADGVHLSSAHLRHWDDRREGLAWVGASCHDAGELALAVRQGVDFAVLSPVNPTASHPAAAALGWARFAELIHDVPLPVYALGGLGPADLPRALAARAQGIAAIRAFWG